MAGLIANENDIYSMIGNTTGITNTIQDINNYYNGIATNSILSTRGNTYGQMGSDYLAAADLNRATAASDYATNTRQMFLEQNENSLNTAYNNYLSNLAKEEATMLSQTQNAITESTKPLTDILDSGTSYLANYYQGLGSYYDSMRTNYQKEVKDVATLNDKIKTLEEKEKRSATDERHLAEYKSELSAYNQAYSKMFSSDGFKNYGAYTYDQLFQIGPDGKSASGFVKTDNSGNIVLTDKGQAFIQQLMYGTPGDVDSYNSYLYNNNKEDVVKFASRNQSLINELFGLDPNTNSFDFANSVLK